jgi:hypothetical protein
VVIPFVCQKWRPDSNRGSNNHEAGPSTLAAGNGEPEVRRSARLKSFDGSPYKPGTLLAEPLDGSRASKALWAATPRKDGVAGS